MDPFSMTSPLFFISTAIAVSGWLALIFFPRRPFANFWYAGVIVPVVLGLMYTFVFILFWFQPPPGRFSDFLTLPGLGRMFENRGLLLAAWVDLVLLPLMVGAWMTRKAAQTKMPYVYLLPCLILTFVFPGTGVVVFAVVASFGGRWDAIEAFEGPPPIETNSVTVIAASDPQLVR